MKTKLISRKAIMLLTGCIITLSCSNEDENNTSSDSTILEIHTDNFDDLKENSCILKAYFSGNPTDSCTQFGFIYSTDREKLANNGRYIPVDNVESDYNFTVKMSELNANTTYYYQAYMQGKKSSQDNRFGQIMQFTTPKSTVIETGEISNISQRGGEIQGKLLNTAAEEYGICIAKGANSRPIYSEGIHYKFWGTLSSLKTYSITTSSSDPLETYTFCAYAIVNGIVYLGEIKKFTTKDITLTAGQAIDLGLTVRWAGWNIGANKPENFGGSYFWGDPTGTEREYPSNERYSKHISGTRFDIAQAKWGGNWKLPTITEIHELLTCSSEWIRYHNVSGRLITGKNGNTIFLPGEGHYWSGDFANEPYALEILINRFAYTLLPAETFRGSVRAVCD